MIWKHEAQMAFDGELPSSSIGHTPLCFRVHWNPVQEQGPTLLLAEYLVISQRKFDFANCARFDV